MHFIKLKRIERVVNIPNLPALRIGAEIPFPEEDDGQVFMNVAPVSIDIWESLDTGIVADSDLIEYWAWLLHYPGIDLSNVGNKNYPPGVIELSLNGRIGLVDGGKKLNIDNIVLQDVVMNVVNELLSENTGDEEKK